MPKLVNTKLILTLILVIVVSRKRRSEDSKMRPTAAYSITLLCKRMEPAVHQQLL